MTGARGGIIFRLLFLIFILVVGAVLYLARVPLLRLAGEFWVVDEPPETSDVIVVLSGDNYDAERATRAAALFKSGMAPRVLATGRALRSYATTTDLMKHDLQEHGVPAAAIVELTHKADNTRDEAVAVSQFVVAHGWKKIILVTSNYHTRRAQYIYEHTLPASDQVTIVAVADSEYDANYWWKTRTGVKIFFHEVGGYLTAWWEMRKSDTPTQPN
ncbi:MAG TPA: YdcF family protein [Candidatus Acidoferrales bacterium]